MTSPHACARCRERLPWYAEGTLAPSERAEVEEHLAGCAACRRETRLWSATSSALKEIVSEPPLATLEGMTWRAIQTKIARDGRPAASDSMRLKERSLMDDEVKPIVTAPSAPPRRSAGPSRRQPFVALAAAVLIIAVGVTLFGVYGARLRQGGSSTPAAATPCAPGQARAHLPAYTNLIDISMVSSNDGWAVGEVWNSSVSGSTPRTIIMRYQHCVWTETGKSIPSAALYSVAMNSASDGWALGATEVSLGKYLEPVQAILLHYTGGSWRRVQFNSGQGFRGGGFSMYSPTDGWLGLVYNSALTLTSSIYHYQGGKWTPVALPDALHTGTVTNLVAGGPDDVWVIGDATNNVAVATIGHYANGQWQTWQAPLVGGRSPSLDAIRVSSPQDVWVFGTYSHTFSYQGAGGYIDGPYALHYNGTDWTRVAIGNLGSPPADILGWTTMISLPDGGFLALGTEEASSESSTQRTLLLRCSAAGCQQQKFPIQNVALVSTASLYSPTQGFAIGYEKTSGATHGTTVLLTYNAGDWAIVPA
jgi:hypothetical protein